MLTAVPLGTFQPGVSGFSQVAKANERRKAIVFGNAGGAGVHLASSGNLNSLSLPDKAYGYIDIFAGNLTLDFKTHGDLVTGPHFAFGIGANSTVSAVEIVEQ